MARRQRADGTWVEEEEPEVSEPEAVKPEVTEPPKMPKGITHSITASSHTTMDGKPVSLGREDEKPVEPPDFTKENKPDTRTAEEKLDALRWAAADGPIWDVESKGKTKRDAVSGAAYQKDNDTVYSDTGKVTKVRWNVDLFNGDYEQMLYAASTLDEDSAKRMVKQFAKKEGYDPDILWSKGAELNGDRWFQTSAQKTKAANNAQTIESANAKLSGIDMVDFDGNKVDLSTMSYPQLVKMAQQNPNYSDVIADAARTLTKTEGSQFYGKYEFNAEDFKFTGNAQIDEMVQDLANDSKMTWDTWEKGLPGHFKGGSANAIEDLSTYLDLRRKIEEDPNRSTYAKEIAKTALNKAFSQFGNVPDDQMFGQWVRWQSEQEAEEQAAALVSKNAKPKSTLDKVAEFFGKLNPFSKKEQAEPEASEQAPSPAQASSPAPEAETHGPVKPDIFSEPKEEQEPKPVQGPPKPPVQATQSPASPSMPTPVKYAQEGEEGFVGPSKPTMSMGDALECVLEYGGKTADDLSEESLDEINQILNTDAGQAVLRATHKSHGASKGQKGFASMYDTLGTVLGGYVDHILSAEYPDELRGDGLMTVIEVANAAFEWDDNKAFNRDENGYLTDMPIGHNARCVDEYLSQFGPDDPENPVNVLKSADDLALQRMQDIADAAENARQENERRIDAAIARCASGNEAEGDRELIYRSGKVKTLAQVRGADETYREIYDGVDQKMFGDDPLNPIPFEETWFAKALVAKGIDLKSEESKSYYRIMSSAMKAVIDGDAQYANVLGMTLGDYYQSQGGLSYDSIAARAERVLDLSAQAGMEVRAKITGQEYTPPEMTADEQEDLHWSGYAPEEEEQQTGVVEDKRVFKYALGSGMYAGWQTVANGFADTAIAIGRTFDSSANAYDTRDYYFNKYGGLYKAVYRQQMQRAMDAGVFAPEMTSQLQKLIDNGADLTDTGINLETNLGFYKSFGYASNKTRLNVENETSWYQARKDMGILGAADNLVFEATSGLIQSGTGMLLATGLGMAGVSGLPAMYLGYSGMDFGHNFNKFIDKDFTPEQAFLMATTSGAVTAVANQNILGLSSGLVANDQITVGANQIIAAGIDSLLGNTFSDVPMEVIIGAAAEDAVAAGINAYGAGGVAGLVRSIPDIVANSALAGLGAVPEAAETTIKQMGPTAVSSFWLGIYGGTMSARSTIARRSEARIALDRFNSNPTKENGAAFVEAAMIDMKDPAFAEEIAKEIHASDVVNTALATLAANPDAANFEAFNTAMDQYNAAKEAAQAAQDRIDTSTQTLTDVQAMVDEGTATPEDMAAASDAAKELGEAQTVLDEKTSLMQQHLQEANDAMEEAIAPVLQEADQRVREQEQSVMEAVQEAVQEQQDGPTDDLLADRDRLTSAVNGLMQIDAERSLTKAERRRLNRLQKQLDEVNAQIGTFQTERAEARVENALDAVEAAEVDENGLGGEDEAVAAIDEIERANGIVDEAETVDETEEAPADTRDPRIIAEDEELAGNPLLSRDQSYDERIDEYQKELKKLNRKKSLTEEEQARADELEGMISELELARDDELADRKAELDASEVDLENQKVYIESARNMDALRDARRARLYVSPENAADVCSALGCETLGEVARRFKINISSKDKSRLPLDSWWEEFRDTYKEYSDIDSPFEGLAVVLDPGNSWGQMLDEAKARARSAKLNYNYDRSLAGLTELSKDIRANGTTRDRWIGLETDEAAPAEAEAPVEAETAQAEAPVEIAPAEAEAPVEAPVAQAEEAAPAVAEETAPAAETEAPVVEAEAPAIPETGEIWSGDRAASQFENETAQRNDQYSEYVKQALKGTTHEVHHKEELLKNATDMLARLGEDGVVSRVAGILNDNGIPGDVDTVALDAMIIAAQGRGDQVAASAYAMLLGAVRTKQGQALSSLAKPKTGKMDAVQVMNEMTRDAYGPVASDAPIRDASEVKVADRTVQLAVGDDVVDRGIDAAEGRSKTPVRTASELITKARTDASYDQAMGNQELAKIKSFSRTKLGIDIIVAPQADMQRVAGHDETQKTAHGFYDSENKTIVLGSATSTAVRNGFRKYLMHEMTHAAEGTKAYGKLKDALFGYAGYNEQAAYDAEFARVQNIYGNDKTKEYIEHEMAAAAMEKVMDAFASETRDEVYVQEMLGTKKGRNVVVRAVDAISRTIKKFSALAKGDKALYDQIKYLDDVRKNMSAAIREHAKNANKDKFLEQLRNTAHPGAQQFSIEQIADALKMKGFKVMRNQDGYVYGLKDDSGHTVKEVTPEMISGTPMGNLILAAQRSFVETGGKAGFSAAKAEQVTKFFADIATMIAKGQSPTLVWEFAGAEMFSALKSNSDPQYGTTIDFGTICSKTQALMDVMTRVMKEKGRGLTRTEVLEAYRQTAKVGYSVPCPVCYVFSRWMGVPSLLNQMNEAQKRFVEYQLDANGDVVNGSVKVKTDEIKSYLERVRSKYYDPALTKDGKKVSEASQIASAKTNAQKNVDILDEAIEAAYDEMDAKYRKITDQLAERMIKQGLDADVSDLDMLERQLQDEYRDLQQYAWVTQVLMDKNGNIDTGYNPIPPKTLFDFNETAEFATKHAKNWKYRTTRGAGMGKAIMPYSGAALGDFIFNGERKARMDAEGKKIRGSKDRSGMNPFYKEDGNATRRQQDLAMRRAVERVRKQNLIGGQRLQSTSDYRPEWGLDYLMTYMEMQSVGSKAQMYTKVIESVDMNASAGAEVNISIMGQGKGYVEDADGNKKLVFSDTTGANFDQAYEKTQQYDNAQMILVGMNDTHIRLALADDRITFVIPWHSSGNPHDTLASLVSYATQSKEFLDDSSDYTDSQTDSVKSVDSMVKDGMSEAEATAYYEQHKMARDLRSAIVRGEVANTYEMLNADQKAILDGNEYLRKLYDMFYLDGEAYSQKYNGETNEDSYGVKLTGKSADQIFPYEYWDKSLTIDQADTNGQRFRKYCESLGMTPRFSQFGDDPGYWKLLIDRRMYNRDGSYHTPKVIDVTGINIGRTTTSVKGNEQIGDIARDVGVASYGDEALNSRAANATIESIDAAEAEAQRRHDIGLRNAQELQYDLNAEGAPQQSNIQFALDADETASQQEMDEIGEMDRQTEAQEAVDEKSSSPAIQKVLDNANKTNQKLMSLADADEITNDNRWGLNITGWQKALIKQYGLGKTELAGANYHVASLKQRMLAAILAEQQESLATGTPGNENGLLTLCQQLEFMRKGYKTVTAADRNYILAQMQEYNDMVNDDGDPTDYRAQIANLRMYAAMANTSKTTTEEKLSSIAYNNMLSAIATWMKNLFANFVHIPMESISKPTMVVSDIAASKKTGERMYGFNTLGEEIESWKVFFRETAKTFTDYAVYRVDTGHSSKYFDTGMRTQRIWQGDDRLSNLMDIYGTVIGCAMQLGDRGSYEREHFKEKAVLERLAKAGKNHMTAEEIEAEATRRTLVKLFQNDNGLIEGVSKFKNTKYVGKVVSALVPFVATPTNVAIDALSYSPFGLAKAALLDGLVSCADDAAKEHGLKADDGLRSFDQSKFCAGLAHGLTAQAIMVVSAALAALGILKRGREDEGDGNRYAVGKSLQIPYGMYLDFGNGKLYSIEPMGTLAANMAQGVGFYDDLVKRTNAENFDEALQNAQLEDYLHAYFVAAGRDGIDQFFEASFLNNLREVFNVDGNGSDVAMNALGRAGMSQFQQYTSPAIIRSIARATDPYVRDYTDDNPVAQFIKQNWMQNIPVLREMLPVATDVTGQPLRQGKYYSFFDEDGNIDLSHPVATFVDSFLAPASIYAENDDPYLQTMYEMSLKNDKSSWLPQYCVRTTGAKKGIFTINKTTAANVKGKDGKWLTGAVDVQLNADQTRTVNTMYGQLIMGGTAAFGNDRKGLFGSKTLVGIRELMDSKQWKKMTLEEQQDAIKDVQTQAKKLIAPYVFNLGTVR